MRSSYITVLFYFSLVDFYLLYKQIRKMIMFLLSFFVFYYTIFGRRIVDKGDVLMGVKIRVKRGKLYLDIYERGKRRWEALRLSLTKDKTQNKEIMRIAEICRSKRETQILAGAWDIQDPVAGKQRLVMYMEEYARNYKNPSIVRSCIHHVMRRQDGGTILVSRVTTKWVEDFQDYLLHDAGLSRSSACNYSKILRAALKRAVTENIILRDPAAAVPRLSLPEADLVFLDAEELQRLADVKLEPGTAAEVRRAFLFACHTGLRISDIETITWKRIERNPPQINKRQEKTKRPVYIPLSGSARKLIGEGEEHSSEERLFQLPKNRRGTYKHLKGWARAAGVEKNIGWHTARRTFATLALENGADVYTVARLLGHASISQAAKYAKVTDRLKREAVAALPELRL
jgi:integrase